MLGLRLNHVSKRGPRRGCGRTLYIMHMDLILRQKYLNSSIIHIACLCHWKQLFKAGAEAYGIQPINNCSLGNNDMFFVIDVDLDLSWYMLATSESSLINGTCLTHWLLVMPNGISEFVQHWFKKCHVVRWSHAISRNISDFSLMRSYGIYLEAFAHKCSRYHKILFFENGTIKRSTGASESHMITGWKHLKCVCCMIVPTIDCT